MWVKAKEKEKNKEKHVNGAMFLTGVELHKEELPASTGIQPKNYWAHKGSLQFASRFDEDEKYVVSILELQSTSNPLVHVVKSFTAPPNTEDFSFSPVSSHASFVDYRKVVILNFQDSRILLQFKAAHPLNTLSGCFSPDGHFFACSNQENEILVWENTSTGYVNHSTITPRLRFQGFSFSPTTGSILTWAPGIIQLLHPEVYATSSPNKTSFPHTYRLVAYSTDRTHIATVRGKGVIMVFNPLLGDWQQLINTEMYINDIKFVGGAIFATDGEKLVGWHLEIGELPYSAHSARRVASNVTLTIVGPDLLEFSHIALSNDCSHIAVAEENNIFMYDVNAQKIVSKYQAHGRVFAIQFSPDGHQLCFATYQDNAQGFVKLKLTEDWCFLDIGAGFQKDVGFGTWTRCLSYGCHIGHKFKWVVDSKGRRLLWLPPKWKAEFQEGLQWRGNFMACLGSGRPEPLIVEFQP
jgi:WD40 repeat protein